MVVLPKVMIIDDDRNSTSLLQTLLEMDGFEVLVVPRGLDVFPKAKEFLPDIFLVDYHLTDISGVEVVEQLRASAQFVDIPIIMASGRDVGKEAKAAGVNLFMVKPYDPSQLSEQLLSFIG